MSLLTRLARLWKVHQFKKSLRPKEKQFEKIFYDSEAFHLSKEARKNNDALSLTYGEISFLPFCALLSLAAPNKDDVFFDLGCGAGKACVAALLAYPIKACHGIELLAPLIKESYRLRERLPQNLKNKYFLHTDDFLEHDITQATIIFINATGFFGDEWQHIVSFLSEKTRPGTKLFISSKRLPSNLFAQINSTRCLMSFGAITVNSYIRK